MKGPRRQGHTRTRTHAAIGLLIAAVVVSVLGGCSTATKDRWLRTFFDDPPVAKAPNTVMAPAAPNAVSDTTAAAACQPSVYAHGPVAAGDCRACHDLGSTGSFRGGSLPSNAGALVPGQDVVDTAAATRDGRLTITADQLCARCHADLSSETLARQNTVVHAPLTGGLCLFCHHPHQSDVRFLLKSSTPRTLCLQCHAPDVLADVAGHEAPSELACLTCHDPHAANRRALLREAQP